MSKLNPVVEGNVATFITTMTDRLVALQGASSPFMVERYFDMLPEQPSGDSCQVKLRFKFEHTSADDDPIANLEAQLKDNLDEIPAVCSVLAINRSLTLGGGGTTEGTANYVVEQAEGG